MSGPYNTQPLSRTQHVSEVITDLWPHRMSSEAAHQIDGIYRATQVEDALAEVTAEVEEVNRLNGWFDSERTFGDGIALLHSELSEALEAFRDHGVSDATTQWETKDCDHGEDCPSPNDFHTAHLDGPMPKPEGVGSEFADVLIRLVDECRRQGIDLAAEYRRKIAYNHTRGHRHGGRAL